MQGVAARRGHGLNGRGSTVVDDELDVAFGHGLDSVEQIASWQRYRARTIDFGFHPTGDRHIQIGGRNMKATFVGVEQHVGEHGHRAALVSYPLATLQQPNETLLFRDQIHGGAVIKRDLLPRLSRVLGRRRRSRTPETICEQAAKRLAEWQRCGERFGMDGR